MPRLVFFNCGFFMKELRIIFLKHVALFTLQSLNLEQMKNYRVLSLQWSPGTPASPAGFSEGGMGSCKRLSEKVLGLSC